MSYWGWTTRVRILLAVLACSVGMAAVPAGNAQAESPFAIRVEAPEVVVPVVVVDRTGRIAAPGSYEEWDEEVTDLAVKDFHVFEDGVEQDVNDVSMELPRIRDARDNISHHVEASYTPRGTWSSPDLWPQEDGVRLTPLTTYLVSYTPPATSRGSCHRIQVRVKRRHATVYSRDEYCNVRHAGSDPIAGMKIGKLLEDFAETGAAGSFPVFLQEGSLRVGHSNKGRVEIAVEFPASAVKRRWARVNLYAIVAILGMVRDRDGNVVGRFSDLASTAPWNFYRGPLPPERAFLAKWEIAGIPDRYETQMELAPGKYELQVVVSDGEKFGTARVPVRVDRPTRELGMSDVLLCNRFEREPEGAAAAARAPKYVPLKENGVVFTPAGDMRFLENDTVVSFFEIYGPGGKHDGSSRFRMKLMNAKTGDVVVMDRWRTVEAAEGAAKAVWGTSEAEAAENNLRIPVVVGMSLGELPAKAYVLDIEVVNEAGEAVTKRSQAFSVGEK